MLIHGSGRYDDMRRMLLSDGIHMIDLGRWLAGEVERLFAHGRTQGAQAASVTMQFANGAVGQLDPSPTLNEGIEAMRLIEAIMRSVESGQPVAVADV